MTPAATRARKPSTTMTAIAQPGNLLALFDCTDPEPAAVELAVGAPPEGFEEALVPFPPPTPVPRLVDVAVAVADDLDESAAAEEADAADADDMEATTQSA